MKRFIISIAAAALVMSACVKENAPVQNPADENLVPMEFSASSDDTKTSLVPGESGKVAVEWSTTDEISVWDGTANRKFTVKSCEGSTAVFTGMVSADATSFYAIYPYTETLEVSAPDNADRDIRLRFPTTEIEYAQPGDLPKGRGIAVAVAADGKFAFQNRTALIKFSLAEDMNDVKSVTIQGNEENDYLWGMVNIEFAGATVYQGIAYGYDRGTSVTLCNEDGSNLQTGVDYYIVIPGNQFGAGFNVTIKYADNTTVTKTSDKAIQPYTKNIISLASAPLTKDMFETPGEDTPADPATSYYAQYLAGQDITIAGKVYNKTTHPDAKLLTTSTTISAAGLYFVKPEDGAEIKYGTTRLSDVVIVGDVPGTRQTLGNAQLKLTVNGKVAIMNCVVSAGASAQLIDENTTADYVAFDNCTIIPANGQPLCYASGATGTIVKEFVMMNSEFAIPEAYSQHANGVFLLNGGLVGSTIRMENNVLYVDKQDVAVLKFKVTTQATAAESLIMKNNTFVNILANGGDSGLFKDGVTFNSVDVQNNLFYVTGMTRNNTVFMTGTGFADGKIENNAYYRGDLTFTFRMFNGSSNTPSFASPDLTKLDADPFSSADYTNGVFVKTDAAAAYGATR